MVLVLRDEIIEMIELFDLYNITEENQRRIIEMEYISILQEEV